MNQELEEHLELGGMKKAIEETKAVSDANQNSIRRIEKMMTWITQLEGQHTVDAIWEIIKDPRWIEMSPADRTDFLLLLISRIV